MISFPGGNTGAQMGGFFRKELKSVADMKGLKFRVGGFAGQGGRARMGLRAAEHSRLARSTRRWKRAPSTPPSGSGPYDDEKLGLSTRWRQNYAYPGWWEGGPEVDFFINTQELTTA